MMSDMDEDDAWSAAEDYLDEKVRPHLSVDVALSEPEEHDSAWTFVYQTQAALDGDASKALPSGHGPVVVPKDGSRAWRARSGAPVMEQLAGR